MTSAADLESWRGYLARQESRFYDACGGGTYIWDRAAVDRATRRGKTFRGLDIEGAYTGPWHTVRPYVTAEFREWVESDSRGDQIERLTLSEWVERERVERERVEGERGHLETADYTLSQLREFARMLEWRDTLIREAIERGASKVETAAAVGLTRQQIHTIVTRRPAATVEPVPVPPAVPVEGARVAPYAVEPAGVELEADDDGWVEIEPGVWAEAA
ncbi:hypothetical protein [Microbacterium lacus]|uniref:hypothetical protein n=1 Tax=Microbacterium lacus TaxID=415217 RepID=UPI000C2CA7FF|nr:hypothetical protein [Microbacterium lacus]